MFKSHAGHHEGLEGHEERVTVYSVFFRDLRGEIIHDQIQLGAFSKPIIGKIIDGSESIGYKLHFVIKG